MDLGSPGAAGTETVANDSDVERDLGSPETAGTETVAIRRRRLYQESSSSDEEDHLPPHLDESVPEVRTSTTSIIAQVRRSKRAAQRPTAQCDGCNEIKNVPYGEHPPAELEFFICFECREAESRHKNAAAASRQHTPEHGVGFIICCCLSLRLGCCYCCALQNCCDQSPGELCWPPPIDMRNYHAVQQARKKTFRSRSPCLACKRE